MIFIVDLNRDLNHAKSWKNPMSDWGECLERFLVGP